MRQWERSSITVILGEAACTDICAETAATVRCKNRLVQRCSVKQQWTNTNRHKDHNWQSENTTNITTWHLCRTSREEAHSWLHILQTDSEDGSRTESARNCVFNTKTTDKFILRLYTLRAYNMTVHMKCYVLWMPWLREKRVALKTTSWNHPQY